MKKKAYPPSKERRRFIKNSGIALGALSLGSGFVMSCQARDTDKNTKPDTQNQPDGQSLGVALVGLGNYASGQLAPALQQTKNCHLSGIVTGTPSKESMWKDKYNIPGKNIYNYKNYDEIVSNKDIDIIYVVLPNAMHAEYTMRAAEAGKHVICEKPMAISVKECEAMIAACKKNNVKLSIGYRLHFEPYNQRVMQLGQEEVYGKVLQTSGEHSFHLNDPNRWRVHRKMSGGGPLMDLGIYVVQGALYTIGENPIEISAQFGKVTKPEIFKDVEESIDFTMKFPGGAEATGTTSYQASGNYLRGKAENGKWELQPAYSYSGIQGTTSDGGMEFPQVNQQAQQMDAFAECIRNGKDSTVPGEMGLRDIKIMMAIYESAEKNKPIQLTW